MNLDGRRMFEQLRGYKDIAKMNFNEPDKNGNY